MIKYILIKLLENKIQNGLRKQREADVEGNSIYVRAYGDMLKSYRKTLMFVKAENIKP